MDIIDLERAFKLIHNLDVREPLRRYAPKWSIVVVDKSLNIVGIKKSKEHPTVSEQQEYFSQFSDCVYFLAIAGESFCTLEQFCEKVKIKCKNAHEKE